MCGITGFWVPNSAIKKYNQNNLNSIINKMSNTMQKRGPDSFGVWCNTDNQLAFGHQRLSIVDLSKYGHQPMLSPSKRFVISYNGEIYNANEIKQELLKQNPHLKFNGHSDTEVLLYSCEIFGIKETLKKLNGMFAFALWDNINKKLFLARDRLGIKPLYWGINQSILFFGSTLAPLMAHPNFKKEINNDALATFFKYNYVPSPLSIFKGIKKLNPGNMLVINEALDVNELCYWDFKKINLDAQNNAKHNTKSNTKQNKSLNPKHKNTKTANEYITELENLLKDSISKRLISDVPFGAFLSGGIDSSAVVALMQSISNTPIETFSIGFNNKNYNEAHHAKKIAKHLGVNHHELYLDVDAGKDIIHELPDFYDEPFADSSQIPTYLVSKLAREHVTVSLSGDGGDELFAGYNRYLFANNIWSKVGMFPLIFRKLASAGIKQFSPRTYDAIAKFIPILKNIQRIGDKAHKFTKVLNVNSGMEFYNQLISMWPNANELIMNDEHILDNNIQSNNKIILDSTYATRANKQNSIDLKGLNEMWGKIPFINWMQYADTLNYLPDDILTKVDRASMAVSLEARVPLLDHRVVEFAANLPMKYKINNGQSKWLLRQVLYKHVPKELIERPKMGFGVPIDSWMRTTLKPWCNKVFSKDNLHTKGLNHELIAPKWRDHKLGNKNLQYELWSILMYDLWFDKYMK